MKTTADGKIDMTSVAHIRKDGARFHPAHKNEHGHTFAIDDHGLAVEVDFGAGPIELTGEQAQKLRSWLNSAELRTQAEHDAIQALPKPVEVNSGIKIEMNDHTIDPATGQIRQDGTHRFATTPAEYDAMTLESHTNLVKRNEAQAAALAALGK
jgi:hypothetical protein